MKSSKKRVLSVLCLAVMLFAFCMPGVNAKVLEGLKENWLVLAFGEDKASGYRKVAEIQLPEEFVLDTSISPNSNGPEPELYYLSQNPNTPLRFFYYTTGYGDCRALAESAQKGYTSFYETYEAGDVKERTFGGRTYLTLYYNCSYASPVEGLTVFEQSAICYYPVDEERFIACILSLSFDSQEKLLSEDELETYMEQATNALAISTFVLEQNEKP